VTRAALIAGLALALGACASAPRRAPDLPRAAAPQMPDAGTDTGDTRSRFVAGAIAMLGQPYRWGGNAPGGFDCSGLVFYAAAAAGIGLPRTAAEQIHAGRPVSRTELRAGDLVFMHLKRKQLHVGIAIDADRFVNAPAAGGRVRVDSLTLPLYSRGFLQARRVVEDAGAPPSAQSAER
jgi:cell wall-associated NlpC family hydrolase